MTEAKIADVIAWSGLNSQGQATVACRVVSTSGDVGVALVPSGTSRGFHEAIEVVDVGSSGSPRRGMGSAVRAVVGPLRSAVLGLAVADQRLVDEALAAADGTPDKRNLGANAILAVSLATAQAAAASSGRGLWQHVRALSGTQQCRLPRPMVSIFSGGLHAPGGHPIQDFLVIPLAPDTMSEALSIAMMVRDRTVALMEQSTGFEVRLAPSGAVYNTLPSAEAVLDLLNRAAVAAGYSPGSDIGIAIDLAAGGLKVDGGYIIDPGGQPITPSELMLVFEHWRRDYGVAILEDPFGDDDWQDWAALTATIAATCQLIGDDLFTTSSSRLRQGISMHAANAVLLKPTQCGTLTELLDVAKAAKAAGYATVVSQRSVETEDTSIADIAVGSGANEAKFGPLVHSERIAKYNRLLELEATENLRLAPWAVPAARPAN